MSKDEGTVSQEIQIGGMHLKSNLLRNNSGACMDETGRLVRYGLGNISKQHTERVKSSDLIGITSIVVTPEMVGQTLGIFTAVEVKRESWKLDKKLNKKEQAQFNFIQWVKSMGGFAGFSNNVDNLKEILKH